MTNHIEEMMETAGVKKQLDVCMRCLKEDICKYCNKKSLGVYVLPDFTTEKQLELIKLIVEIEGFCGFTNLQDKDKWSISCGFNFPIGPNPERGINFNPTFRNCETFSQAVAQLTTELMKAGELDKEKVKRILEE